jgi:hypothetical protein
MRRKREHPNKASFWYIPIVVILFAGFVGLSLKLNGLYPEKFQVLENDEMAVEKTEIAVIKSERTSAERLSEAYENLHESKSALKVKEDFPDLEVIYTDDPLEIGHFPEKILPFRYYYSEEVDITFNLCSADRSVFICEGKLDRLITEEDIAEGRCEVTSIYLNDPRIGDSGKRQGEPIENT